MAVNPAGYVPVHDGGVPRSLTGKAIEGVLPGYLVSWSGAADPVSSGINSFATSDILVHATGSGLQVGGVAMGSAASGNYVAVATRGTVIVRAGGTVTNGTTVISDGAHGVLTGTTAGHVIGRAICSATSGGYALINLTNL